MPMPGSPKTPCMLVRARLKIRSDSLLNAWLTHFIVAVNDWLQCKLHSRLYCGADLGLKG